MFHHDLTSLKAVADALHTSRGPVITLSSSAFVLFVISSWFFVVVSQFFFFFFFASLTLLPSRTSFLPTMYVSFQVINGQYIWSWLSSISLLLFHRNLLFSLIISVKLFHPCHCTVYVILLAVYCINIFDSFSFASPNQ